MLNLIDPGLRTKKHNRLHAIEKGRTRLVDQRCDSTDERQPSAGGELQDPDRRNIKASGYDFTKQGRCDNPPAQFRSNEDDLFKYSEERV